MRISDWSSDVCSSDLPLGRRIVAHQHFHLGGILVRHRCGSRDRQGPGLCRGAGGAHGLLRTGDGAATLGNKRCWHFYALGGGRMAIRGRSEEHTSELQSLMRISYAVFCLNKKTQIHYKTYTV